MKKKKLPIKNKFEFSTSLAEVMTRGRTVGGFTLDQVAEHTKVDKRTIINMENGTGNPTLEKLFPVMRLYATDPRPIFYPEMTQNSSSKEQLRFLLEMCSEEETLVLIPIMRAILNALRTKRDDDLTST